MKTIAIDVGGSSIKYGLFDKKISNLETITTPKNKKDFLLAILKIAAQFPDVNKIGIGLPGIVDRKTGKILNLPNLKFLNNFNIVEYFQEPGFEVRIDNDVKCWTRAELHFGVGKKYKNFVLLAIGTGIGGGIVIDKKIYYGKGAAGELGHVIIDQGKDLSAFAAGKTLKRFDAAEMKRVSKYIGYALASIVNIFDPEVVVLGGGVTSRHVKEFLPNAIKQSKKLIVSPDSRRTPIIPATIGDKAAVIGAGLLFSK